MISVKNNRIASYLKGAVHCGFFPCMSVLQRLWTKVFACGLDPTVQWNLLYMGGQISMRCTVQLGGSILTF